MSYMFEVYYKPPVDPAREDALGEQVARLGGRLDGREAPTETAGVCLTFEFDGIEQAEAAADALRRRGEHVEGPYDYGA
jgi:hypothetical protein